MPLFFSRGDYTRATTSAVSDSTLFSYRLAVNTLLRRHDACLKLFALPIDSLGEQPTQPINTSALFDNAIPANPALDDAISDLERNFAKERLACLKLVPCGIWLWLSILYSLPPYEPLSDATIPCLTRKTVFLIALASVTVEASLALFRQTPIFFGLVGTGRMSPSSPIQCFWLKFRGLTNSSSDHYSSVVSNLWTG